MKRLSLLPVALVLTVLAVAAVGLLSWRGPTDTGSPVAIGGPFTLRDGHGHTVSDASFRGKWMLVYFGYTHCPDACPTALNDMANALDLLGKPGRNRVVPIFITVDPDRDTPTVMEDYVSAFDAPIVALSGDRAQVVQAEQAYRVFAEKHPGKNGEYEMDHSSIIYVMDPQGRFITNFTQENSPKQIADRLRQLGI